MKGFATPLLLIPVSALLALGVYIVDQKWFQPDTNAVGGDPFYYTSAQLADTTGVSNGDCLITDGTFNSWSSGCGGSSGATTLDGLNDVTITSSSTGNILYLAGSGQWINLATGSDGQVLKLASGIPSWDTDNTAAGGSGLGTTTPWTAGQLAVVATDGLVKSIATSTLSENISGLEFDANPWIVGSARTLSLSSGYVIPLSASTTEWTAAYASTTALTPAYIRGLFSNTATGLTYNSSTGATSLTSGYIIPLSASTTEWTNFYNTPSSRITAGTGLTWNTNTLAVSTSSLGLNASFFEQNGNSFGTTATLGTNDANNLAFETNNSTRMTITSSGNVGIGTTGPGAKLEISGTGGASQGLSIRTTVDSSSSYTPINFYTTVGLVGQFLGTAPSFSSGAFSGNEVALASELTSGITHIAAIGTNGIIKFTTGGNTTGNERMRITSTGNVGIGTTTPGYKLDVVGGALRVAGGTGSTYATRSDGIVFTRSNLLGSYFNKITNSMSGVTGDTTMNFELTNTSGTGLTTVMSLNGTGNVGIGTTTPAASLHVYGGQGAFTGLTAQANNQQGLILFGGTNGGTVFARGDVSGGDDNLILKAFTDIQFNTFPSGSETTRVVIKNNGNVGIGTSTPATALSVVGTSTTNALRISGLSNTLLGVDASGNVVATSTSGAGTVTSVAATVPTGFTLTGSPITSSGTLAFGYTTGYSLLATTTLGSLIDGATAKTTPADNDMFGLMDSAASNVLKKFSWANLIDAIEAATLTVTGSWNLNGATIKQHTYKSFTWPGVATTTAATTTIPLGTAYTAEAWNGADCWVTSGSGAFIFTDGTNRMNGATATTTVSRTTLSTNNTFTAQERRYVEIGPLTNAMITCSVDVTINN